MLFWLHFSIDFGRVWGGYLFVFWEGFGGSWRLLGRFLVSFLGTCIQNMLQNVAGQGGSQVRFQCASSWGGFLGALAAHFASHFRFRFYNRFSMDFLSILDGLRKDFGKILGWPPLPLPLWPISPIHFLRTNKAMDDHVVDKSVTQRLSSCLHSSVHKIAAGLFQRSVIALCL